MPSGERHEVSLYVMPASGSAPPRPQVAGLGPSTRWWWSADGRRLRYLAERDGAATRLGAGSIAEAVRREEVRLANAMAWSPDHTAGLDRSRRCGEEACSGGGCLFTPLMEWRDAERRRRNCGGRSDGTQVIARNAPGRPPPRPRAQTGAVVDDPVAADKQPAGWIRWNGKQQLVFIDEQWKRLVVMESVRGPAYTLVTLGEDGSPSLVLSPTKGS
jgi:hypothetical protein